ncbi:Serpentine Receptor, class BC (Class B-like) [Caenorhabditis elegans]|uniref:Serpentine Receptor, class BC (Class B-like) n=1 Tax=Caenorhabditis elegans TaxID=6239 RepID=Q9XVF5_CAEEL|nr:Serpentine Receptor, class BC (Class B-like) [Caenorhabditis elegans]CAB03794.1 Serpentine Receptor, class BC (Class B-like) [Caenorhabditis elegans]|eukprot:NP_507942.1 Serpentine Receptor, class BC (class B-like) [Caenorhabditis elegans]
MLLIAVLTTLISILFAITICYLNFLLLISIFWRKRIPVNLHMMLTYCRFGVDLVYTIVLLILKIYYMLTRISNDFIIKNLYFLLVFPAASIGNIRSVLTFLIALERVIAIYFPIFFHIYRQKLPNFVFLLIILSSELFNQYMLFGYCGNVLETPLECVNYFCAVNSCYYRYWFSHQQIVCFLNGAFSVVLFLRLTFWSYFSGTETNKDISRATRIALLDFFIMLFFNIIPLYISSHITGVNLEILGLFIVLIKTFGFLVEGLITYRFLFNLKIDSVNEATVVS